MDFYELSSGCLWWIPTSPNIQGKKEKHINIKQIRGIVPGLGGCQKFVYVLFGGHSLWGRKTHKQKSSPESRANPVKCLFMCFFLRLLFSFLKQIPVSNFCSLTEILVALRILIRCCTYHRRPLVPIIVALDDTQHWLRYHRWCRLVFQQTPYVAAGWRCQPKRSFGSPEDSRAWPLVACMAWTAQHQIQKPTLPPQKKHPTKSQLSVGLFQRK